MNDVGIIHAASGTIVVAFFTAEHDGDYVALETHMGRVSKLIVDRLDGVSSGDGRE